MKIYTRTGDDGSTGLFGGGRVRKDHPRVEAYGSLDELNSTLGLVRAQLLDTQSLPEPISPAFAVELRNLAENVALIQSELFDMGSQFASSRPPKPSVTDDAVKRLESWIDAAEAPLPELKNFILPGGTVPAATLHVARTVCRRAERRAWEMQQHLESGDSVGFAALITPLIYLNRLSDLCFVWARWVNHALGSADVKWQPRGE